MPGPDPWGVLRSGVRRRRHHQGQLYVHGHPGPRAPGMDRRTTCACATRTRPKQRRRRPLPAIPLRRAWRTPHATTRNTTLGPPLRRRYSPLRRFCVRRAGRESKESSRTVSDGGAEGTCLATSGGRGWRDGPFPGSRTGSPHVPSQVGREPTDRSRNLRAGGGSVCVGAPSGCCLRSSDRWTSGRWNAASSRSPLGCWSARPAAEPGADLLAPDASGVDDRTSKASRTQHRLRPP